MEQSGKSFLIDANIWIAYFIENDSQSKKAQTLLEKIIKPENAFFLSMLVIQEVVTLFLYKNKPHLAQNFITLIHQKDNVFIIPADQKLLHGTFKLMEQQKYRPKLSFNDWSLLFLASEFRCELLTFDYQLEKTLRNL